MNFLNQQISQVGQRVLLNVEYKLSGLDYVTLHAKSTNSDDPQQSTIDIGKTLISEGYALCDARQERRLQSIVDAYNEAQNFAKTQRVNDTCQLSVPLSGIWPDLPLKVNY